MIKVPNFPEFTAKKVFDEVKNNARFQRYLPDFDNLKHPPNKQYLFNVSGRLL
jgi:hypothetical protein